jgi:hypothetical protein
MSNQTLLLLFLNIVKSMYLGNQKKSSSIPNKLNKKESN